MDILYNLKEAHMIKAIKHQTSFILKQNIALIVFYILLAIVFFNFSSNVLAFQGSGIIEMCHPAKLLVLSYNQTYDTPARVLANGRGFLRHGRTPQRAITSPLHPVTGLLLFLLLDGCLFCFFDLFGLIFSTAHFE